MIDFCMQIVLKLYVLCYIIVRRIVDAEKYWYSRSVK